MNLVLGLILLLPLGLSSALILKGFRGFRIGDHPICRKCGFDLFGKPSDAARCGECGTELNHRRAFRIGNRHKRAGLLAGGLTLLTFEIGFVGIGGYEIARESVWIHRAPLWYVLYGAVSSNEHVRAPAMAELETRVHGTPGLAAGNIDRVIAAGLGCQADFSRPWDERWGELIEYFKDRGFVSPDQWHRYLQAAADFPCQLQLRKVVYRGASLPYRLTCEDTRIVSTTVFDQKYGHERIELKSGNRWIALHENNTQEWIGGSKLAPHGWLPLKLPPDVEDGLHTVRFTAHVDFTTGQSADDPPPDVSRDIVAESTFQLVSRPQGITVIRDPKSLAMLQHCMRVATARWDESPTGCKEGVFFWVDGALPKPVAYDVTMLIEGKQRNVGPIWLQPSDLPGPLNDTVMLVPFEGKRPDKIDLILHASSDAALKSIGITEIIDGDLRLNDVKVR